MQNHLSPTVPSLQWAAVFERMHPGSAFSMQPSPESPWAVPSTSNVAPLHPSEPTRCAGMFRPSLSSAMIWSLAPDRLSET